MRPVILVYSFSGNNRLLAGRLAERLDCPIVEVTEPRARSTFRIMFDLLLRRFPKVAPIALPEGNDHVLIVAPLWDKWIAHPMRSALRALGASLGPYSFVSFSGGERPGQVAFVDEQLAELIGHAPQNHWALYVERLVDPAIRGTPKVSAYRVAPEELASYPELEIVARLGGPAP